VVADCSVKWCEGADACVRYLTGILDQLRYDTAA
jgi:hypothetical protein